MRAREHTSSRSAGGSNRITLSGIQTAGTMWKFFYLFGGFLALGQSDLTCEVTQTPNGTLYLLQNVSASDCTHNWSTGSTVVSTNKEKNDEVVIASSINALLTKTCYEHVTHYRSCISKKEPMTATCNTSCPAALQTIRPSSSANLGQRDDTPKPNGTPHGHFGVPVSVGLLLIVVVAAFVYRKTKKDNSEVLPR
ncbi:uncharacterized protein LOC112161962 [Oryzias melastigma]|uniref:uncharacterized protein LOC112161962 n=1 Tax=Oryzias melastigma TaxID=30732 RepID=UPI000CF8098A|nr:uncharacterized protein LOC112161962 [Oryzias melastigma]